MEAVLDNTDQVLWAFAHTVALFLIAGVLSLLLGTFLAALRVGPVAVLRRSVALYVSLVRNTPLVVVFIFFRYAGPSIGIRFNFVDIVWGDLRMNNFFAAAIAALTFYTSTFVCEAIRSGVNAVPVGQAEAARAIGLPFGGTMRHVILPQAFRASVPPVASVQIALLKNTSVAGVFGVTEAVARMSSLNNDFATQRTAIFLFFAAVYIVLVEIVSFGAHRLERRWRVA